MRILIVYRNFNQTELDLQYNVRASIPDHLDIFQRWKDDSKPFRNSLAHRAKLDLRYGTADLQSIDLFLTETTQAPIVVFIHGGYWQSLDKSDFSYVAKPYLRDGINFATINYRLTPGVSMDDLIADNRSALVWLYRNAARFGCNADAIYVTGSSAGGHLTAEMVSTRWEEFGAPVDLVKGGCALSGLYDLEPIRLCYLNEAVQLDAESARRNSPISHVPLSAPPLLLAVGGDESGEFHRQQADFLSTWTGNGLTGRIIEQVGGHHFDMCDRLGDPQTQLYQSVIEMVRQQTKAVT